MNDVTNARAFLPTPEQQQLLNACLLNGEDAVAAWRLWRAQVDLDRIDLGSIRLLPLLAENLSRLGIEDPSFGAYRGVQRRTWARNQMLYRGAGKVLEHLKAAGIPVMVLKGTGLALTSYEKTSLRPMGDIDLLVKQNHSIIALDLIERLGWRPQSARPPHEAADFAIRHACAFEDPTNPEVSVDLHWRLLWAQHCKEAELALWQEAVPLEISGVECLSPSPADMLIHICVHGAKWNDFPPLRWVVDAVLLLRRHSVDWTYLRAQSAALHLDLQLADTLSYLRFVMQASIPEDIIQTMASSKPRPIDRLLYETELYPPEQRNLQTILRMHWHIAHSQLWRSEGIYGCWRYLVALRAGRSLREMATWTRRRIAESLD